MAIHPLVTVSHENGVVKVVRNEDTKKAAAMHGMSRAICANLVHGVSEGFTKELDMRGIGYRATINGQQLSLTLGFSHPVVFDLPKGVSASTRPNPDPKVSNSMVITLQGASKEQVGTIAAAIRAKRPPEPYKGKGIRYLDERIILKAGKSGKKA
jgi:large subunit ribosomal protein L6